MPRTVLVTDLNEVLSIRAQEFVYELLRLGLSFDHLNEVLSIRAQELSEMATTKSASLTSMKS